MNKGSKQHQKQRKEQQKQTFSAKFATKTKKGNIRKFWKIPVFPRNRPCQTKKKNSNFQKTENKFGKCFVFSTAMTPQTEPEPEGKSQQNLCFIGFSVASEGWGTPNPQKIDTIVSEERAPTKKNLAAKVTLANFSHKFGSGRTSALPLQHDTKPLYLQCEIGGGTPN